MGIKKYLVIFIIMNILYYYFYRMNTTGFSWINLENSYYHLNILKNYLYSFPSFSHIIIFSLLTWIFTDYKYPLFSISIWLIINMFFEAIQAFDDENISYLPYILKHYAINGTFDWFDILALFLGGFVSYYIMQVNKKGLKNEF